MTGIWKLARRTRLIRFCCVSHVPFRSLRFQKSELSRGPPICLSAVQVALESCWLMISTPSPRKEREPVASRRRFGWSWLAGAVLCLALLVLLLVRDVRQRRVNAPERMAEKSEGRPAMATFPKVETDAPVERSPAGPSREIPPPQKTPDSPTTATWPAALVFQKTRTVLTGPKAGAGNAVSIRELQPAFVKSPVYVLAQGPARVFTPGTWLRVVVTFDMSAERISNLTFRYRIFVGEETFGGSMTHADIFGAGEHQLAVFVIPAAVKPLIERPAFDASKSVAIEVTALHGETELARAEFGRPPVVSRRERLGLLRSVESTPFAPLEIDLYEPTAAQGR